MSSSPLPNDPTAPELKAQLVDGHTAADEPMVTARSFHARVKKLMKWIRSGASPIGKVEYVFY